MSTTTYIRDLTVAEAAGKMRVSDETLRRAIRAGAPHDRLGVGGRAPIRVSADELRAWYASERAARTDRRPKIYSDELPQYDEHGVCRQITIVTDGANYHHDWHLWTEAQRDEADAWTLDMHDAMQDLAAADPHVRARAQHLYEYCGDSGGEYLRAALEQARDEEIKK